MVETIKKIGRKILESATYAANKEQGRKKTIEILEDEVGDLSSQYTTFSVTTPLLTAMVRCLHAFQVGLIQTASEYTQRNSLDVVDIGDSSGTHLWYLQSDVLFPNKNINALSVNLDPEAVEKIKQKGLSAIKCRAEKLTDHPEYEGRNVDIFLSFETLEHLFDPISFLKSISDSDGDSYFVLTVPYLKKSRVALHQIRKNDQSEMCAENTHIFELSPEDWKLLFQFSGWKVEYESTFRMFPKKGWLRVAELIWKWFPFDGYYGCILSKDDTYSSKYDSWE